LQSWLIIDTSFAGDAAKEMFGELPMNSPVSVARGIAQACADPKLNGMSFPIGSLLRLGKTFWVMDNELTEIEGPLHDTMELWLGKKNTKLFKEGARRLQFSPIPKQNSTTS